MPGTVFYITEMPLLVSDDLLDALFDATTDTLDDMQQDFEACTEEWDHPVEFTQRVAFHHGIIEGVVTTDDQIFHWVDQGTAGDYIIEPREPGHTLAYQEDFEPKTLPEAIGSQPGGKSGAWVTPEFVIHPGIEARHFSQTIADKHQTPLEQRIQQNITGVLEAFRRQVDRRF